MRCARWLDDALTGSSGRQPFDCHPQECTCSSSPIEASAARRDQDQSGVLSTSSFIASGPAPRSAETARGRFQTPSTPGTAGDRGKFRDDLNAEHAKHAEASGKNLFRPAASAFKNFSPRARRARRLNRLCALGVDYGVAVSRDVRRPSCAGMDKTSLVAGAVRRSSKAATSVPVTRPAAEPFDRPSPNRSAPLA
jgi:hypothetical protein